MKITLTVLSAAVFAAFIILFVSVKRWQTEENVAKYEKTTQTMLRFAKGMLNGHQMSFPEVDAWGSKFISETNDIEIVSLPSHSRANLAW